MKAGESKWRCPAMDAKIAVFGKGGEVYVAVNNVFDRKYEVVRVIPCLRKSGACRSGFDRWSMILYRGRGCRVLPLSIVAYTRKAILPPGPCIFPCSGQVFCPYSDGLLRATGD
jgi:hypothetical protein